MSGADFEQCWQRVRTSYATIVLIENDVWYDCRNVIVFVSVFPSLFFYSSMENLPLNRFNRAGDTYSLQCTQHSSYGIQTYRNIFSMEKSDYIIMKWKIYTFCAMYRRHVMGRCIELLFVCSIVVSCRPKNLYALLAKIFIAAAIGIGQWTN